MTSSFRPTIVSSRPSTSAEVLSIGSRRRASARPQTPTRIGAPTPVDSNVVPIGQRRDQVASDVARWMVTNLQNPTPIGVALMADIERGWVTTEAVPGYRGQVDWVRVSEYLRKFATVATAIVTLDSSA